MSVIGLIIVSNLLVLSVGLGKEAEIFRGVIMGEVLV